MLSGNFRFSTFIIFQEILDYYINQSLRFHLLFIVHPIKSQIIDGS